jgi:CheY-specific phosphatase CheX
VGTLIHNDLEDILEAASYDVLESMCFFGIVGHADTPSHAEEQVSAKVQFHGEAAGELRATLDYPAAYLIAAHLSGEEAHDIEPAQMEAVICELANLLCEAVLSRYRKDGLFQLSDPEIVAYDELESGREVSCVYELETGCIKVSITLQESSPCSRLQ